MDPSISYLKDSMAGREVPRENSFFRCEIEITYRSGWLIGCHDCLQGRIDQQQLQRLPKTPASDCANRKKGQKHAFRGIFFAKDKGYRASVSLGKKAKYASGLFETPEEAAYAHDKLAVQLLGR